MEEGRSAQQRRRGRAWSSDGQVPAGNRAVEQRTCRCLEQRNTGHELRDSCVLLRFLQRSGLDARWVFVVRTWPFAAHCWLQLEDTVLDDMVERLAAYEPILAVG